MPSTTLMSSTTLIEQLAGIEPGSALARALSTRAEVMRLSQASHDAVIVPREPGGLSHGLRAALAARMARQNTDPALAAHYEACLARTGEVEAVPLSEPERQRIAAILRHADMLTLSPRDATRADIAALKAAGVEEADIVRLAELAAFVNYQIRVLAGLKVLRESR
jgi:uncharacterized protein YciW